MSATATPVKPPEKAVKKTPTKALVKKASKPRKKAAEVARKTRTIFICANEPDQLGVTAQLGDGCIRADQVDSAEQEAVYIRTSVKSGTMADWTAIQ